VTREDDPAPYDLAVIGGGINGCGIARDAAGRGFRVFLCEAGDLGAATSSASTKLIHGGLRYLEYSEFRLVREALREREALWGIAPHIIRPLRLVLPHHKGLRPAWLLRLGLFFYDHLGDRRNLPPTRTLHLRDDPAGRPLKPAYTLGFAYFDCRVDDSRLVVLNARDAAGRGAVIAPRTRCLHAGREDELWTLTIEDHRGKRSTLRARALVNAAGPWVAHVLEDVIGARTHARIRLVQGSHIVVPRLYPEDHAYVFQNEDRRILFVIPYEEDFTLIGTTDRDFAGVPESAHPEPEEIAYLCTATSEYLLRPVTPEQVVWSFSGVRPLYDDGAASAQAATRDYVLELDAPGGAPPLLSVFGGKITTYRRLAEASLAHLAPYLPPCTGHKAGWTAREPLPGGGFAIDGFAAARAQLAQRYPFLAPATAKRLLRAYGTCIDEILMGATTAGDLGTDFGAVLTEAELRYLARREWAMTAEDVIWRRSKLGLRLSAGETARIEDFLASLSSEIATPSLRPRA
jgi:glycerol-3-phosphate dehydrogenase